MASDLPARVRALAAERDAAVAVLRDLVDALPKCSYPECTEPATRAWERGGLRWCDDHGAHVPEYPRAEPLRRALELLEARRG